MGNKRVFLIVLNWNAWQMTANCLASIAKAKIKGINLNVVIVDNGSVDGSVEKIKELTNSKINGLKFYLIESKENLGFAEGNNVGLRYSLANEADYICLLNNDTRVSPDFLVQLIKAADAGEKIGIVGGKIYFEKGYEFYKERYQKKDLGKVIWYAGGKMDWQNVYASHRGVDEVDKGQYETVIETEYVNGCLMLVKREVFEEIGFFDPKYYLYFEENDFCQRAKKAGFKLFYAPQAKIWHLNAGSSGAGSSLHDYFLTRNRLLFGFRWAPWRAKLALVKESGRLLLKGREWQKIGVRDFYLGRFGKGSWN
ncbi:MAG TPA: glycosyltransferase family 2 protein [Clostridia bacterium]|nr:glycosyltransferase family 2 protein [Clostridia bacterium]